MPLVVPEQYKVFKVVGLDPGLNHTGVAEIDVDFYTGRIVRIEAFTLVNDKLSDCSGLDDEYHPERTLKLLKLQGAVINVLQHINPTIVGCEAPFYNRLRPMAFGALLEVVNVIYLGVIAHNVNTKFITIPPMSVKKMIGAKAAKNDSLKGKDLVKAEVLKNVEIMSTLINDISTLSEHAIDAICVGYTLIKMRGYNV